MKTLRVGMVFCLSLVFVSATAQTAKQFERGYGPRETVYSVSTKVWMTPEYDRHGEACLIRLYPRAIRLGSIRLEMIDVLSFLNEWFPPNIRGPRAQGFGTSETGGGVIWTKFHFENIRFVLASSFRVKSSTNGSGEGFRLLSNEEAVKVLDDLSFDESEVAEYRRKEALRSDDDLMRERSGSFELLEITWPNRKCELR